MDLKTLVHEVGELRDPTGKRLNSDIRGFINRAQRTIAGRRNWTFQFNRADVTIPTGESSVALDASFKELAAEKSPVSYTSPDTGFPLPVRVVTRAWLERQGAFYASYLPVAVNVPPIYYVFMEQTGPGGSMTLNIPPQNTATQDLSFHVAAYWFPEPLSLAGDHNWLSDDPDLADALVNLAKSLAYFAEDPTDERGIAARGLADIAIKDAGYADARRRIAGMACHW